MTDWRLIRPGYCFLCNQRPMSDHNFAEWLTAWARGKPYARLAEIDVILQDAMGQHVRPRRYTHAELLAMGPPPP